MQYCIYLRKSRADIDAEAHGEGETLARHERALLELAKRQKFNITAIYKEVVSGETIVSRPVMQQLLSEVEQCIWAGVLVMEIERLARGDTIEQGIMAQTFKYSDTKIITPMKTYDPNNEFDEEYFEFGLFMSRREYKAINRRLQRGRLLSVKDGKYVANTPPYGYVRKKLDNDKGFTLEIQPEEAAIIKMIYELYTIGEKLTGGTYSRLGVSLICRKLNALKIKPKKADAWVPASIRDILINPVYNGKIHWNWRPAIKKMEDGQMVVERPRSDIDKCVIINGLHEAIIDDETWNLAQSLMKKNPAHRAPSKYQLKNPLSGIVICGKCGRRMVRRPYGNKNSDTLMCPLPSCDNVSSRLAYVEGRIIKIIEKWLVEYKINWNIGNKKAVKGMGSLEIKKKALKKLDDEITDLKKQSDNIHDLLEQGIYSAGKFVERSKILFDKIKAAEQDRNTVANEINIETIKEETRQNIIPKAENLLKVYAVIENPKLKNDLLKEILEKVIYIKTVNARWHNSPEDFQIDLYPKLSK